MKFYKTYQAGDVICWPGDKMEFLASVVFGVATLSNTLEDGRVQVVGLLLPSDFIGRPTRNTSTFEITAATDVTLCCFEHSKFRQLMSDHPHLSERLLDMTMDELDSARSWMTLLGRKTAHEKIASFLEMLLNRQAGTRPDMVVHLPLTRDEIANYLGLTLETVSRQLSKLRDEGLIEVIGRRHIRILDREKLMVVTGNDSDSGMVA